jgi:wyosine [tRNA(Phe)-imidazoG37] synthetase (radical SAM superfamily)
VKYIYGPVYSWRLARSLGIDPLSQYQKVCSFNCLYCQLGKKGVLTVKRRKYIGAEALAQELSSLPPLAIDYITFSGRGEPTLAENLKELIQIIKNIRKEKVAVLTNSSLLFEEEVRETLTKADFVMAKLDSYSEASLRKINRPANEVNFEKLLGGIKCFKNNYHGKFALQVMFTKDNRDALDKFIPLVQEIAPDELQINTPHRASPVSPLSKAEIFEIKSFFQRFNIKVKSVYDSPLQKINPLEPKATLRRRGAF